MLTSSYTALSSTACSGLRNGSACCARSCNACRRDSCSTRPGGKEACCPSAFHRSGVVCSAAQPDKCVIVDTTCIAPSAWSRSLQPLRAVQLAVQTHWSDRYSSLLKCGGHELLFSRRGGTPKRPARSRTDDLLNWHTVVRRRVNEDRSFASAEVALQPTDRMSHNAAFLCTSKDGDEVVAFGGRSHLKSRTELGVRHLRATAHWPLMWRRGAKSQVMLNGSHAGCVEARKSNLRVIKPGVCEFDGRLSTVQFRGRHWLFARANLHPRGGARHVQVTSSQDGLTNWSNFEVLEFDGVEAGQAENNIYFLLPVVLRERMLLGLFPGVINGAGGPPPLGDKSRGAPAPKGNSEV